VKLTEVPEQIAPVGTAAILTLAGTEGVTDIVIELEVAGLPVAQRAEDVIATVTTSLLARVMEV
jgi:hypothetical protein